MDMRVDKREGRFLEEGLVRWEQESEAVNGNLIEIDFCFNNVNDAFQNTSIVICISDIFSTSLLSID